jgi:alkylation response protein AidB-like acyl-CoA dehydrogenase
VTRRKLVDMATQVQVAREFIYRDSRILSIGGGTTEIMKEIIGRVTQF